MILADAPIGVILPPSVAPVRSPKYRRQGSNPVLAAIPERTGSIVATYGILSMKAEIRTDPQTITV